MVELCVERVLFYVGRDRRSWISQCTSAEMGNTGGVFALRVHVRWMRGSAALHMGLLYDAIPQHTD